MATSTSTRTEFDDRTKQLARFSRRKGKKDRADSTSSFSIEERICLHLDYDLALVLGAAIFESGTENKALLALAHQLKNLSEDDDDDR